MEKTCRWNSSMPGGAHSHLVQCSLKVTFVNHAQNRRNIKDMRINYKKQTVNSEPQTQPDICRVSSRAAMAGDGGAWGSAVYPKKGWMVKGERRGFYCKRKTKTHVANQGWIIFCSTSKATYITEFENTRNPEMSRFSWWWYQNPQFG